MRILMINPHYSISETPSPPLGLAFLAAVLENAGYDVRLLDYVVFPYSKKALQSEIERFEPRIVCITSVTMTFDNAIQIVKDVKSIAPEIPTVMGGPHVTFYAHETLDAFPELDIIAIGEGEDTVVAIANAIKNNGPLDNIRGIVYRNGSKCVHTGDKKTHIDINTLPPPARHLLPLGRYKALNMCISMTTSRGCPFKCIFCVGRKMVGAKVRYRDPLKVVDELEYLSTLNFPQINIADDLFTANKAHCFSVCDEIIRRKIHVKWTSFARVDTVSLPILEKMKAAGCTTVSFGVESGNRGILKTIKKGITPEQVITAVKMCTTAGISPHASFILGLPGETPATLKETIDFGNQLKDMGVSHGFHLLAPFPGTYVRDKSHELGISILTNDWRQYHANRAIVETPAVDRKMLDSVVIEWEENYKRWLEDIGTAIKNGNASEEDAAQVINLERTVLLYELMMSRAIENHGTWEIDGDGEIESSTNNRLRELIERIDIPRNFSKEKAFSILRYASEQRFLVCIHTNKYVKWTWKNHL